MSGAKFYVFLDGSFANNSDLSSQIRAVIVPKNEIAQQEYKFTIKGNIIHRFLVKTKKVTKSVLASEILAMSSGVDITYMTATTLEKIKEQLQIEKIPMIVFIDSYSLYKCLVKLSSTKEKRLMTDIMALRLFYVRREIMETRWINREANPANAVTKAVQNLVLSALTDTNSLKIHVDGWVKRSHNM